MEQGTCRGRGGSAARDADRGVEGFPLQAALWVVRWVPEVPTHAAYRGSASVCSCPRLLSFSSVFLDATSDSGTYSALPH